MPPYYSGVLQRSSLKNYVMHPCMHSSPGWEEPGQTPAFEEFTLVLAGMLRVETQTDVLEVRVGQTVHAPAGEWVRYSTPEPEGAEYVSVCLPAFSPHTVHRDA